MKNIKILYSLFLCLIMGIYITGPQTCATEKNNKFKIFKQQHDLYEKIDFDSLEFASTFSSEMVKITGYLLKAEVKGKAPAVIIRPACNGLLLPKKGIIRPYHMELADILHKQGITIFMIDGFTPRGYKMICQERASDRRINQELRIKDTLAGLNYLRSRDDVDSNNIFLLTYGATGGLKLLNKSSDYFKKYGADFSAAVMFFPQCDNAGNNFSPYAPIQVLVGEQDAWNPAGLCRDLARSKTPASAAFNLKVYPDTYHAFVKKHPPKEVDGPTGLGRVMVGGNPESTADAYRTTVSFLAGIIVNVTKKWP